MSKERDRANTSAAAMLPGLLLFSIGLYGVALGEAVQLLLERDIWPGALGDDAFMAPLFGSLGLILVASVLMLVGLFSLRVHWLAVLATFLFALLMAYVQGQLFPTDPGHDSLFWFLTYGGLVVTLSFLCLAWVKGIWSMLWQVLLVTGIGTGMALAFFLVRGRDDWTFFPGGLDVILVAIVIGLLILFVGYRLTTMDRVHSL